MTLEELRRCLEDPEKEEWEKALEVALLAFQWFQKAATPEGRVGALRLLLYLSNLLSELQEYIDSNLNDLISTALPGSTLQEALQQGVARLEQTRQEIARLQEALKQWQEQEAELEKHQRELDRLRAEVRRLELQKEELERLAKLADPQVVEALRQQVEGLKASLPPSGMDAQKLEEELKQMAEQRVQVDEQYLALLRPEVQSVLKRAEALEQELQEVLRQLEEARARYQEAQQKLERWKAEIQPYVEADKHVAQALGANEVVEALEQAERRWKEAEDALALVMERHEEAARRPMISLTGEPLR